MDIGYFVLGGLLCLFLLLLSVQIIPNRIVLISHGRHDEAPAGGTAVYPGMLLQMNASNQVVPHGVPGGAGPMMVVEEDAWQGGDITQVISGSTTAGTVVPFRRPVRGDLLLMLLQNGQNVATQTPLQSAGDGTLIAATAGSPSGIYEIVAPSADVTNTTVETTFSNGSYTMPANSLNVGDVIHIQATAVVSAQNSTNTHQIQLKIGTTVTFDATALALAAAQYVEFDIYVTVRSLGATGKVVAQGTISNNAGGTVAVKSVTLASTTLDTTVTEVVKITTTASAASTGNIDALQVYRIEAQRVLASSMIVMAQEAVNNSGGTGTSGFNTAAFIRCQVP